jgi:hypothetical protein
VDGVRRADAYDMFVNVITLNVVKMAVIKIVNMAFVANCRVPAVRAVLMVGMVPLGGGGHESLLLLRI